MPPAHYSNHVTSSGFYTQKNRALSSNSHGKLYETPYYEGIVPKSTKIESKIKVFRNDDERASFKLKQSRYLNMFTRKGQGLSGLRRTASASLNVSHAAAETT